MQKTVFSAIVALLAACKAPMKMFGIYTDTSHRGHFNINDTIILDQRSEKEFDITKRTGVDYKDPQQKDTFIVEHLTAIKPDKKKDELIIKETGQRIQLEKRRRVLCADGISYWGEAIEKKGRRR